MDVCAVLWGNCVGSWGSRHHKWHDGMAGHLSLAHGMHIDVDWQLMEAKIHKHLFSSFLPFLVTDRSVVVCGVSVFSCGGEGHFRFFYGRARHHLLVYKGYP
jgi:hypothetical protein